MSETPWVFTESPDGTLRVKAILTKAFSTRGEDGNLYQRADIAKLEQQAAALPVQAKHYESKFFKDARVAEVESAKLINADSLQVELVTKPPPATPEQIYERVRDKLRTGKWKAISIGWDGKTNPYTRQLDPRTRVAREISYVKTPRYPYCQFISVTASKQSKAKSTSILTPYTAPSTLKEHQGKTAMSMFSREQVAEILKGVDPKFDAATLVSVSDADLGQMVFAAAKQSNTIRDEATQKLILLEKAQAESRGVKATGFAEKLAPSLVPEEHVASLKEYFSTEAIKSQHWPAIKQAFNTVGKRFAELDTLSSTSSEIALTAQAPKRQKGPEPVLESKGAPPAPEPEEDAEWKSIVANAFTNVKPSYFSS